MGKFKEKLKLLKFIILAIGFLKFSYGQDTITSPCPNVFQYQYEDNKLIGVIQVPSPAKGNNILLLFVFYLLEADLPTDNGGRLELVGTEETIQQQISNGEPLLYVVRFPIQNKIPKITAIIYNNIVLCNPPSVENTPTAAAIRLEHTFDLNLIPKNIPSRFTPTTIMKEQTNLMTIPPPPTLSVPLTEIASNLPASQPVFEKTTEMPYVECGIPNRVPGVSKWPWSVDIHIYQNNNFLLSCGGTLISSRVVLSAAHCFKDARFAYEASVSQTFVIFGQFVIKTFLGEDLESFYEMADILLPNSIKNNIFSYDSDIAAVILKKKIHFNEFIRPACLWNGPSYSELIDNQVGLLIGWKKSNVANTILAQQKLTEYSITANCGQSAIPNRTFCGQYKNGQGTSCSEDIGSGFVIFRNQRWELRGILTVAHCNSNYFVIFTDAAKLIGWIRQVLERVKNFDN